MSDIENVKGNWRTPRNTLLDVAVTEVIEGHLTIEEASECLVRNHYFGKSKPAAARRFQADLQMRVGPALRQKCHDEATSFMAKVDELIAEGWRFLQNDYGGGVWYHHAAGSVNRMGGDFDSYETATNYTFHSPVRLLHCVQGEVA